MSQNQQVCDLRRPTKSNMNVEKGTTSRFSLLAYSCYSVTTMIQAIRSNSIGIVNVIWRTCDINEFWLGSLDGVIGDEVISK
jgi:hypothetical protein